MTDDKSETIEEWAARVALTLDADDWWNGEALRKGGYLRKEESGGERAGPFTVGQWRALLAYRGKIAAGLDSNTKWRLRNERRPLWMFSTDVRRSLAPFWLAEPTDDYDQRTPFGREIARVLEASRG